MSTTTFLLLNLALSFYNTGTIWAHEVDIFRSWRYVSPQDFQRIQDKHWRKLPYWVFTPVGLSLVGAFSLIWYHPAGSPPWGIWGNLLCQLLSLLLTISFLGRLQARLSKDPRGPDSPYLALFLRTHWIRTLLVTAYAFILLCWTIRMI